MIRLLAIAATMTAAVFGQNMTGSTPSACPSGMVLTAAGRCECPAGTTMTSTGSCAPSNACPYTYNGRCVDVCPPDTLIYGNQCVLSCPAPMMAMPPYCVQSCPPYMMPVNGTCTEPTPGQMCQMHMPGSIADPAGDCVCPQGQWIVRDWNVTDRLGSRCAPVPMSSATGAVPPPMACHTFIRNTTYVPPPMDTCQCVREMPVIVPNSADPFLPYACAPPNTQTPIKPCPPPTYFDFRMGQCMNATMPEAATATATPTATQRVFAPSASPTQSSKSSSGGGIAATASVTQTPKTADTAQPQVTSGSTPTASVTAQPTQRVIQEPTPSASMTVRPSQRPQEPSATQTPKDSTNTDATVSAEPTKRPQEPSATQTPKDSSNTDATVSAEPTKRPQEPSATQTSKDSSNTDATISAEPTKRPQPSMEPSQRPTPPFTPRPTLMEPSAPFTPRPTQRPTEFSAPPTRRPLPTADVVWAADVTRKPLPSFEPTRMPPVRMTAMPSPWRPARNITIALEDRPPYIASQIKFPGANVTAFQRPEKIQEIQMTLACTLRLPLEKIRVTNVTLTDARGIRTVIDAARFALSSNGTIGCYVVGSVGAASSGSDGRVSLRRLQAANSQAEVDYYIVEPPTEVLALTPTEFSAVMESSPALADLSASVGSSGVLALSEASLAVASAPNSGAETPAAANGGAASVSNAAVIGGAVGGMAMVMVVIAAVVGFTQMRKRHRIAQSITRSGSVHVVQHTVNPIGGNPVRLSPTQLQAFAVGGGSMRLPVAFEATKTRSGI